jgi:U3 small nucleolar RNA-associated protein 22
MIDEEEDDDEDNDEEEEGDYIEGEDKDMESGSDADDDGDDEQDDFMAAAEHEASSGSPLDAKNKSLYKAPTNEEIQGLQESADLFKSNIFKLQIEELLKEVHIDYKKAQPLEAALRKLKDIFDKTPAHHEVSVSSYRGRIQA